MKKLFQTSLFLFFSVLTYCQQAELHIENKSGRQMTIKVMSTDAYGSSSNLHSTFIISPHSKEVRYFSKTGYYFLKTKAVLNGRDPIYKKGDPFEVYVGRDGYSVLTLTYSIQESNYYNPTDGKTISRSEFERN